MSEVNITVHTFSMGTDKEAALKPLEEAAETFGAWQALTEDGAAALEINGCDNDCRVRAEGYCIGTSGHYCEIYTTNLADEIADTIQACVNLADRYGLDLQAAMERCEQRNRARGRYELSEVKECRLIVVGKSLVCDNCGAEHSGTRNHYTDGSIEVLRTPNDNYCNVCGRRISNDVDNS